MRTLFQAAILVPALLAAAPAAAQVTSPGPVYYNTPQVRVSPNQPYRGAPRGDRWGGNIGGRWSGGMRAPGGWDAYRRPSRGRQLDRYWMSSSFQIPDYYSFGLGAPPSGYFWVRYYDDAVMVDSYGRIRDSVSGVSWGGASASASASSGYASASSAAAGGGGYGGHHGPITQVDPNAAYYQDDGYAEDSGYAEDGGYAEEQIPYPHTQGGYAPPVAGGPPAVQCPNRCPRGGYGASYGSQYASRSYGSQGYASGGYYGGGSTTTVVITYPAVTTTTTIEEEVTEEVVSSSSYSSYVSRPRTKLVRRGPARHPTKRLRRSGCGC